MILVFILLALFIIILTVFFLILLSTFHIEIDNLEATNMKEKGTIDYAIILSLYLFNKLKWMSIKLNNEKLRKIYSKMKLEKIDFKKIEKDFRLEDLKVIKKLQIKLPYFNLQMQLGMRSPVVTAFVVAVFSSLISVILPHIATNFRKENYQYTIQPIYQNKDLYKIQFNCIIQVKMVHIINVILIFLKKRKRRSDLNERTTSNRRSYGYSYE